MNMSAKMAGSQKGKNETDFPFSLEKGKRGISPFSLRETKREKGLYRK